MRNYPRIYSQRDPQWAGQRLGTANDATIGQYGCYLTSFAMTAGYFGHQITPNALDDIFTNKSLYADGDLISNDDDLSQVFSDIQFVQVYPYLNDPADLNLLKELSANDSVAVILELDFDHDPNDGIETHFVCLHEYDGNTFKIYDPWYGTDDDFSLHYGNNPAQTIQKFVVYKGNPVGASVAVDANVFPQLVDKATKYDAFHAAGYTTVDDVIKKVGDLTNANTQLQQDVQTLQGQISDMATAIQKVKDEDIQTVDDSITAQHQRDSAVNDINFVKSLLGLTPQATDEDMHTAVTTMQTTIKQLQDQIKQFQSNTPQFGTVVANSNTAFSLVDFIKSLFSKNKAGENI